MEEVDFIVLHALARLWGIEVDAQTTTELTEDGFNRAKAAIADAIMTSGNPAPGVSGFTSDTAIERYFRVQRMWPRSHRKASGPTGFHVKAADLLTSLDARVPDAVNGRTGQQAEEVADTALSEGADLVVSAAAFQSAVDEANVWKEAYWATAMRLKDVAELLVDNHTALVAIADVSPELIASLVLLGVGRGRVGDVISARISSYSREQVLRFVNDDERMQRFFQEGPGNADA